MWQFALNLKIATETQRTPRTKLNKTKPISVRSVTLWQRDQGAPFS
jgi:hypothetical protein